jgi:hypothetical protein
MHTRDIVSEKTLESDTDLKARFLSAVLPRIQSHAEVCLRDVRCPGQKAELAAEMVALGWAWFVALVRRGKNPDSFSTAIATFAGRAIRSGRKLCGQDRAKDALSFRAQRLHGFRVGSLPEGRDGPGGVFDEALAGSTKSRPDVQAQYRLDFRDWRRKLTGRDRAIADDLMLGEPTSSVAAKFGLSPSRISQLRGRLKHSWEEFCGDEPAERDSRRRVGAAPASA